MEMFIYFSFKHVPIWLIKSIFMDIFISFSLIEKFDFRSLRGDLKPKESPAPSYPLTFSPPFPTYTTFYVNTVISITTAITI